MGSIKEKLENPAFMAFAKTFRARLRTECQGNMGDVAQMLGYALPSISSWGKPKKTSFSLPDIWEAQQAAVAKVVSPSWLAFAKGPKDPAAAEAAFKLGNKIEETEGLAEVVERYINTSAANRAVLRQVAANMPIETKTIELPLVPAPAPSARESAQPLPPLAELEKARNDFQEIRALLQPKNPAYKLAKSGYDRLNRLCASLQSKAHAAAPAASAGPALSHASADAVPAALHGSSPVHSSPIPPKRST